MTTGLYNTIGAENTDELNDNGFDGRRSFNELTWLVHPSTYFDLTDTLNLEVGGTWFGVEHDSTRNLLGVDVTLRHQPGTSGFYQGLVVGSEWYWNNERFGDIDQGVDPDTGEAIFGSQRFKRNGGYALRRGVPRPALLGGRARATTPRTSRARRNGSARCRPSRPGCRRSSSACACRAT